ncbi:MAG: cytochrome P450, partial [Actinomycetota bacterium]|nr:cytochrome P450 [Actinomycetota bacterium]
MATRTDQKNGSSSTQSAPRLRRSPATPSGPAWLGMVAMARDPLSFLIRSFVENGDFVRTRIGPTRRYRYAYLAARPDYVEHVLKTNQANYIKAPTYRPIRHFLGEGLLTSEGDTWMRHRRLAQQSFYKDKLQGWVDIMATTCGRMLDGWRAPASGEPVDISLEFSRITLAVVGRTLFHSDLTRDGSVVAPALGTIQSHIERRILFAFTPRLYEMVERLPTRENRRNARATSRLDALIHEIIGGHRAEGSGEGDLLSSLMSAREAGKGLSDSELRDEAMTFLLAGHETTANALTWTWYLLSKNLHVLEELQGEADSVIQGEVPTAAEVERLEFTRAVIEESMRLYPPAWLIEREATRDDELDGYEIPAGSVVMVSPYVTHRHP